MPSVRVSKELNDRAYFLTFTIKNWYYVLDRYNRWNIIANSLKYFQENKELKLYGFVFMINHIHLLVSSPDVAGFLRDFKKFTAREILGNIKQSEPKVLKLFEIQDERFKSETLNQQSQRPPSRYQFWSKTNMPELIASEKFFLQKMKYIHDNPVKRNYVMRPEDWYWSSANSNCELRANGFWGN